MKQLLLLLSLFQLNFGKCQQMKMRSLEELIHKTDPAWSLIKQWMLDASNTVQVLGRNPENVNKALYQIQVTTRSPMGAIVYHTGGILVDDGWIRILGSGSEKMKRSLPDWNKGKSFDDYGQAPAFLLIADDAIGGFFALNGGAFGQEALGEVFYLSPDNLEWEPLGVGYFDFIYWAFTGDINKFYEGLRWENWRTEVKEMGADRSMSFYPYLWTRYEDLETLGRKDIPVEEAWSVQMDVKTQLENKE